MATADCQAYAVPDAMHGVSDVGLVSRLRGCAVLVLRLIDRQRRRSSRQSALDVKRSILRSLAAAAVVLIASGIDVRASPEVEFRCEHTERVAAVSGPQTLLETLHVVCPLLAASWKSLRCAIWVRTCGSRTLDRTRTRWLSLLLLRRPEILLRQSGTRSMRCSPVQHSLN